MDERSAVIDETGMYRYVLGRRLGNLPGRLLWVMLNPSRADHVVDDPTIRKCKAFGHLWGFGEMRVVNLFAFRATDPKELLTAADPVGPENDKHIGEQIAWATRIVLAWGNVPSKIDRLFKSSGYYTRSGFVTWKVTHQPVIKEVLCLGWTGQSQPRHPLYLPYTADLIKVP